MSKINVNLNEAKQGIKRIIKLRDETIEQCHINWDNCVFQEYIDDEDKAEEKYSFAKVSLKITHSQAKKLSDNYLKSFVENVANKNFTDDSIRIKTVCNEPFMEYMQSKYLDKMIFDNSDSLGYGDGPVKYFNIDGFDFYMKVRATVPIGLKYEVVEGDFVKFTDTGDFTTLKFYKKDEDYINIDFYFPSIVKHKEKQEKEQKELRDMVKKEINNGFK